MVFWCFRFLLLFLFLLLLLLLALLFLVLVVVVVTLAVIVAIVVVCLYMSTVRYHAAVLCCNQDVCQNHATSLRQPCWNRRPSEDKGTVLKRSIY